MIYTQKQNDQIQSTLRQDQEPSRLLQTQGDKREHLVSLLGSVLPQRNQTSTQRCQDKIGPIFPDAKVQFDSQNLRCLQQGQALDFKGHQCSERVQRVAKDLRDRV